MTSRGGIAGWSRLALPLVLFSCSQVKEPKLVELEQSLSQLQWPTMSLQITSYCDANYGSNLYNNIQVTNLGVSFDKDLLKRDTDLDGVVDEVEIAVGPQLGIKPASFYSVLSPFSDLTLYKTGIRPLEHNRLRCSSAADKTDADGDGLMLCEERLLQTDPDLWDTDGDGLADSTELRCGSNPKDGADAVLDPDGDKVPNREECRLNTPTGGSNQLPSIAQAAYGYEVEKDAGSGCLEFSVTNIPINAGSGSNVIRIYFTDRKDSQAGYVLRNYEFTVTAAQAVDGMRAVCEFTRGATGWVLGGKCEVK